MNNSNIIKSVYDKDSNGVPSKYKLQKEEISTKSKVKKPFSFSNNVIRTTNNIDMRNIKRKRTNDDDSDDNDYYYNNNKNNTKSLYQPHKPLIQKRIKPITLVDCINSFLKKEKLSSDNCWYCNKCKKHVQAEKKFDLWKLPEILILHIKRFSTQLTTFFSNVSLHREKDTRLVKFPIELDLSEFVIGGGKDCKYELFAVSVYILNK